MRIKRGELCFITGGSINKAEDLVAKIKPALLAPVQSPLTPCPEQGNSPSLGNLVEQIYLPM
jgi:hypothetical protein